MANSLEYRSWCGVKLTPNASANRAPLLEQAIACGKVASLLRECALRQDQPLLLLVAEAMNDQQTALLERIQEDTGTHVAHPALPASPAHALG